MEVRGCPGGARGLPYRDRGGREQVEAGPARQRRAHVRRRTGRWEQVREEEDKGEWAGLRWASPWAGFSLFQIVLICCLFKIIQ